MAAMKASAAFESLPTFTRPRSSKTSVMQKREEVLVVPVVWPCDNDLGIVKDYWDDQFLESIPFLVENRAEGQPQAKKHCENDTITDLTRTIHGFSL